jgi:hypothetical protein
VLRDRKGIRDFIKSVPKYKDTLDPIRVISHIVRNLAWVVTGSFPASYERAVEIVYSDQDLLFDKQSLEVADKMIKLRDIHTHDDQLSSIECLLKDAERDLEHLAAGGELH